MTDPFEEPWVFVTSSTHHEPGTVTRPGAEDVEWARARLTNADTAADFVLGWLIACTKLAGANIPTTGRDLQKSLALVEVLEEMDRAKIRAVLS